MRFIIEHHHFTHLDHSERSALELTLRNMENRIMAEIDDLKGALEGTQTDLDAIKGYLISQNEKITILTDQLTQLSQCVPPQVQGDVGAVLNMATSIKSEADAIVASFTPAEPAPTDPAAGEVAGETAGEAAGSTDGTTDGASAGTGEEVIAQNVNVDLGAANTTDGASEQSQDQSTGATDAGTAVSGE